MATTKITMNPVGRLVGGQHAICHNCAKPAAIAGKYNGRDCWPIVVGELPGCALYAINVERYNQHCHECGASIAEGSFGVDLFSSTTCLYCADPCPRCGGDHDREED